jgi:hypothetical protein
VTNPKCPLDLVFNALWYFRQRRAVRSRPSLTAHDFARLIQSCGGDAQAAHLIHKMLLRFVYARGFTPDPKDDLLYLYGIAEEELDEDLIAQVLSDLRIPAPSNHTIESVGSVRTPLDIAKLVRSARIESERTKG